MASSVASQALRRSVIIATLGLCKIFKTKSKQPFSRVCFIG